LAGLITKHTTANCTQVLQDISPLLLHRRDTTHAHAQPMQHFQHLSPIAVTGAQSSSQIADDRLRTWAEATFRHLLRPLCLILCTACQTTQNVPPVFSHFSFEVFNLDGLLAHDGQLLFISRAANLEGMELVMEAGEGRSAPPWGVSCHSSLRIPRPRHIRESIASAMAGVYV
jgi:hypothetical protein